LDPDAAANYAGEAVDEPVYNDITSAGSSAMPPVIYSSLSHLTNGLTTDDVVLMFKTGVTVLWKRVPIYIATTFSSYCINSNNLLLYSDYPETIGKWEFIDVLSNSSE
jgi:hypothetical protein